MDRTLDDEATQLARIWMDFGSKMMSASLGFAPTTPPPQAAREVRDGTLGAVSQTLDQLMRTPQYLDGMRDWLDTALNARKQFNEFFTRIRHETQGVTSDDVDAIMRSVRHLELRVLDRLDDISSRMDAMAKRLDAIEAPGAANNGKRARPARKEKAHIQEEKGA